MKMNSQFWDDRYKNHQTGWDIGYAAPAFTEYFEGITDKNLKILIPGAGNGYEAEYLFLKGFTNVFVLDIALTPLKNLKERLPDFPGEKLLQLDFFDLEDRFDMVWEQTFFCAIDPSMRMEYVVKMHGILKQTGKLAGLLFNFPLTETGPPFGGDEETYRAYFLPYFNIEKMETAYNSIKPRKGRELFFIASPLN